MLGVSKCVYVIWEYTGTDFRCLEIELWLAVLWCGVSAWLSYLLINNLMARWLIYYTPTATIVRLFSINAINAYLTSSALALIGENDSRMLLPAWIFVASVLAVSYHATLRKLWISREYSPTVYVLCATSFCSMCMLVFENNMCSVVC